MERWSLGRCRDGATGSWSLIGVDNQETSRCEMGYSVCQLGQIWGNAHVCLPAAGEGRVIIQATGFVGVTLSSFLVTSKTQNP